MSDVENQTVRVSLIGHYAGFITRLFAFIIDTIVISAVIFFFSWFFHTSIDMLQIARFVSLNELLLSIYNFMLSPLFASLASVVFIFAYYVLLWTLAGQTVGKAIMGVKVIPNKGGKMSLGRSVLRYLGYYVSGVPVGLGFLWILVDDRRFAWHDRLANTCVVYVWDARPDENFLVQATEELRARREALKRLISRRKKPKFELPPEFPPAEQPDEEINESE